MAQHITKTDNPRLAMLIAAVLALASGIAVSLWWAGQSPQAPQLTQATWLTTPRVITDFQLVDHEGNQFTSDQFKQHWSLLFFGYTHCPDVCPTTMAVLQQTAKMLAAKGTQVPDPQFVFVSVDPKRDTPAVLNQYVRYFNKNFIGVTGEPEAIEQFTRQLGIYYSIHDSTADNNYAVDHSASILLIDPQARLSAVLSPPHKSGILATNVMELARFYKQK